MNERYAISSTGPDVRKAYLLALGYRGARWTTVLIRHKYTPLPIHIYMCI